MRPLRPVPLLLFALVAACGGERAAAPPGVPPPAAAAREAAGAPESAAAAAAGPTVVFLGDSLTAGLGLAEEEAFPALVAAELARGGWPVRAVNAGVSGDTSAGGLARLDWLLGQSPAIVVVGLGANDGLRGLALERTEANLRAIVERSRAAGARVLLLGMKLPPNYGPDYTARFEALYPRLAEELALPWVPFLLDGVAAEPELNLPDGIHPNAEGQRIVARNVLGALEPLVREAAAAAP